MHMENKMKRTVEYEGSVSFSDDFGNCTSLREVRANVKERALWFKRVKKLGAIIAGSEDGLFLLVGTNPALRKLGFVRAGDDFPVTCQLLKNR